VLVVVQSPHNPNREQPLSLKQRLASEHAYPQVKETTQVFFSLLPTITYNGNMPNALVSSSSVSHSCTFIVQRRHVNVFFFMIDEKHALGRLNDQQEGEKKSLAPQ
jgi:hypothetical protein